MSLSFIPAGSISDQNIVTGFELSPVTGYVDTSKFSISYINGTRTFSLTPIGTLNIWRQGIRYSLTDPLTLVVPSNSAFEGVHVICFTGTSLRAIYWSALTIPEFDLMGQLGVDVPVSILYWDSTNSKILYMAGGMWGSIFLAGYMRASFFTYRLLTWTFGGGFSGFTIGDGSLDSHAQFQINSSRFFNVFSPFPISSMSATSDCMMGYRIGSVATPVLRESVIDTNQKTGFKVLSAISANGRLMFNPVSGGNYVLQECTNNYHVNYFYFASSDYRAQAGTTYRGRFLGIPGIREYQNLSDAVTEASKEILQIINDFRLDQFYLLGAVHFQTNNVYANAVKAKIIQTTSNLALGIYYTDLRGGRAA